jgi:hypothetical protein
MPDSAFQRDESSCGGGASTTSNAGVQATLMKDLENAIVIAQVLGYIFKLSQSPNHSSENEKKKERKKKERKRGQGREVKEPLSRLDK